MNKMIKQSVQPQASRMTFYLLSVVMIGFGLFAEHHAHPANDTALKNTALEAQTIQAVLIDP